MLKVTSELDIYEIDDVEIKEITRPKLLVKNHWLFKDRCILEYDGMKITVSAFELHTAINNATN